MQFLLCILVSVAVQKVFPPVAEVLRTNVEIPKISSPPKGKILMKF